jgi:hypothetical protein
MGWNQNSRLDLLHALWIDQTFHIDEYHDNTGDKSVYKGHYYSDKAPGIVFLALPAFAVSAGILNLLDIPLVSPRGWRISSWIATAGSVGVITALGGVAMFLFLHRFFKKENAFLTAFVTFLGASPFPYATMLFSHAAVAGLISIALWAISDQQFIQRFIDVGHSPSTAPPAETETRWLKRHLLAGFCCGFAISSEFTAVTAAGGVLALACLVGWQRGMFVALGAIPPLLLIPIYNWICFEGSLSFGYHNLALTEFQQMNKGLFGVTFPPKIESVYLILFSPARGLFFWTPFFMLALFSLGSFFRRSRVVFAVSVSVILLHMVLMAGYYMPSGGAALGPRHLTVILPFISLLVAAGLSRFPGTGFVLGCFSLLLTTLGSLINAAPPSDLPNPLFEFYLPQAEHGEFAPCVISFLGASPWIGSAFLFCAILTIYYYYSCDLHFLRESE